jgi:hypothetical protein
MWSIKIEMGPRTVMTGLSPKRMRNTLRRILKEHGFYTKTKLDEDDTLYFDSVPWNKR